METADDWFEFADTCPCEGCKRYCKNNGIVRKDG